MRSDMFPWLYILSSISHFRDIVLFWPLANVETFAIGNMG